MWFKIILIVLIIAMLVSLSGALASLFNKKSGSKRTVNLLTIRVTLACLILLVLTIGLITGELSPSAPWSGRY